MSNFLQALLVASAIFALIAIGPWVKVATALNSSDDRAFKKAMPHAAIATALFLGVFVLFGGSVIISGLL